MSAADMPVETEAEHKHRNHQSDEASSGLASTSEMLAGLVLIAILAWAQFPLGSNRPWSWSLLTVLVAGAWILWLPAGFIGIERTWSGLRRIAVPGIMLLLCIGWAGLQSVSWTPHAYHNPIWDIVGQGAGTGAAGAISMNPFATATEAMKLLTYVCAGFLAYALSRRQDIAHRLFVAIVVIGVFYAVYGFALSAASTSQGTLLENITPPPYKHDITGGFVAKNSFATYTGMTLVIAVLLIVESARHAIVLNRGSRQFLLSVMQYALGRGVLPVFAAILLFCAIVASDSRAGLAATVGGLFVLFLYGIWFGSRLGATRWVLGAGGAAVVAMGILFLVNGASMQSRMDNLVETNSDPDLRPVMWNAARHAIADHPYLGSGLGTFGETYLLYADRFEPYIFDRVHNDYLELALGLGIPAAVIWVLAMAWLFALCAIGVLRRRRRRIFALGAVGCGVLVAIHSAVDFSLQMPAVSLLFAVILGIGLAQSARTATTRGEARAGAR